MDVLATFLNLLPVTLAQGLLYGFVAFGIMVPFRLLNFPDLSCEGAFPLGGCLCAALLTAQVSPFLAVALAVVAGFLAGCTTALIYLRLRINTLLAGILVVTMLWSINLRIMGKSNIPLFALDTLFDVVWPGFTQSIEIQIVAWTVLVIGGLALAVWLLRTDIGLGFRAVGSNETMARAQGIDTSRAIVFGLGAANALVSFAGAAVAQTQGYADVGMGFGLLINGLAALIIGEALIGRRTIVAQLAAPFVGSIAYYQVISLGLAAGVHPSDLKLVTGLFVVATLGVPAMRAARRGTVTERRLRA